MTPHNPSQRPMFTTPLLNWLFFDLFFFFIFHTLKISTYKISHLWQRKKIHVNRLTFVHKKFHQLLLIGALRHTSKTPGRCLNNKQLLINQNQTEQIRDLLSLVLVFFLYRAHGLFAMISDLYLNGHPLRRIRVVSPSCVLNRHYKTEYRTGCCNESC